MISSPCAAVEQSVVVVVGALSFVAVGASDARLLIDLDAVPPPLQARRKWMRWTFGVAVWDRRRTSVHA